MRSETGGEAGASAPGGPLGEDGSTDTDTVALAGTVKWFDVTRGFGFAVADDESIGDILIHFSVLEAYGRRSLPEGARVETLSISRGRGFQAREITVDRPDRRGRGTRAAAARRGDRVDPVALVEQAGPFEPVAVKWFNRLKGYGFLVRLSRRRGRVRPYGDAAPRRISSWSNPTSRCARASSRGARVRWRWRWRTIRVKTAAASGCARRSLLPLAVVAAGVGGTYGGDRRRRDVGGRRRADRDDAR